MESRFTVAIIGLGLIGGSLAYALRGFRDCVIKGYDLDGDTLRSAVRSGAVDNASSGVREAVAGADVCIFATNPAAIITNLEMSMPFMKDGAVVIDICGIKRDIVAYIDAHLEPRLQYAGLHPMAGREVGGFVNADAGLFRGAGFITVPAARRDRDAVTLAGEISYYIGASRVVENTADEHDGLIAYTSDLMHVAATALVHDFPAGMTMAHTAGAFRDSTRVARIDADLWTELLSGNAENLLPCMDVFIDSLAHLRSALASGDRAAVREFLSRANANKERILTL